MLQQRLRFGHDAFHDLARGRNVVDQPGMVPSKEKLFLSNALQRHPVGLEEVDETTSSGPSRDLSPMLAVYSVTYLPVAHRRDSSHLGGSPVSRRRGVRLEGSRH